MKTIEQKFTIHPVGQGLFYSGEIKYHRQSIVNEIFRLVFDCGSFNKANCLDEVTYFRTPELITGGKLDLLVISHFDADHINHIGNLLEGNIKVKKLVMPIISFEERLFISMKLIENRGYQNDLDFPIRFIIDPLGTIADNLDDESEVFLIDSSPIPPSGTSDDNKLINEVNKLNEKDVFIFDFDEHAKKKLNSKDVSLIIINNKSSSKIYKVKDDNLGKLYGSISHILLMEFIFYKRSLGQNEDKFFKEMKKRFYSTYSIDDSIDGKQLLNRTIEIIKKIYSWRKIRKIFKESSSDIAVNVKGRAINDLNTTSLCLLHRNLPEIFGVQSMQNENKFYHFSFISKIIQKPDGTRRTYFESDRFYDCDQRLCVQNFRPNIIHTKYFKLRFPNVLLTSDSFLKEDYEVDQFYSKYSQYWDNFWLFQIPHHGAKRSSDILLFSKLNLCSTKFINYGATNVWGGKWHHPSPETINNLVATGHSQHLISVNEFNGLQFMVYITSVH